MTTNNETEPAPGLLPASILEASTEGLRELILTESLANYAHEAWSGWMRYLFEKSTHNDDGTITIPAWAVERWQRQMNTPYVDLPESEKDSDRAEAEKMLAITVRYNRNEPQSI